MKSVHKPIVQWRSVVKQGWWTRQDEEHRAKLCYVTVLSMQLAIVPTCAQMCIAMCSSTSDIVTQTLCHVAHTLISHPSLCPDSLCVWWDECFMPVRQCASCLEAVLRVHDDAE